MNKDTGHSTDCIHQILGWVSGHHHGAEIGKHSKSYQFDRVTDRTVIQDFNVSKDIVGDPWARADLRNVEDLGPVGGFGRSCDIGN